MYPLYAIVRFSKAQAEYHGKLPLCCAATRQIGGLEWRNTACAKKAGDDDLMLLQALATA